MTTTKTTLISEELKQLIDQAAKSFVNLGQLWNEIKQRGIEEGHTEDELQDIITSQIRKALPDKLTPEQAKKKLWYVFHREEHIERVKRKKQDSGGSTSTSGTKFRTNDDKKGMEETSTDSKPTDSYYEKTIKNLEDTVAKLRAEVSESQENISQLQSELDNTTAELESTRRLRARDLILEPGEKKLGPFAKGNALFREFVKAMVNVQDDKWEGFYIIVKDSACSKVTAFGAQEK